MACVPTHDFLWVKAFIPSEGYSWTTPQVTTVSRKWTHMNMPAPLEQRKQEQDLNFNVSLLGRLSAGRLSESWRKLFLSALHPSLLSQKPCKSPKSHKHKASPLLNTSLQLLVIFAGL